MKLLITGTAGFIGFSIAKNLLHAGHQILGLDSLNDYYDPTLKKARLDQLQQISGFQFEKIDIADSQALSGFFEKYRPTRVLHLAAQAGVRYSLTHPEAYIQSNLVGFANLIENCRNFSVDHLVYASTSSVYGANERMPFSVHQPAEHPISLYAATKKANELMAHSYSWIHQLPTTGLRFFTVYGPWGRPDMALFLFTQKLLAGEKIEVFNGGHHQRDFTYIDDIVEGVCRVVLGTPAKTNSIWSAQNPDPASSRAPYAIYNIGRSSPEPLMRYIEVLEKALKTKAKIEFKPMQAGDVPATWADVSDLVRDFDYRPKVSIDEGVGKFVEWYRSFYRV